MFKVPAYSQFLDVKDKKWQRRSCGIVVLKMILDFWGSGDKITADNLIKLGLKKNAYISGIGWRHKDLTLLSKNLGFKGKNYDWFKNKPKTAFKKLLPKLKKQPIIASICKNLNFGESGHLVVLAGFKNNHIFFNDPDSKTRKGIRKKASLKKFLNGWKRRVIVIYP